MSSPLVGLAEALLPDPAEHAAGDEREGHRGGGHGQGEYDAFEVITSGAFRTRAQVCDPDG